MTHPNRRPKEVEQSVRRSKVAMLLLAGVTESRKIAEQVQVDRSTVSRDIQFLEKQFHERATADITAARGLDLARTDRLIQAIWKEATNGNKQAIDRVLSLMQHRSRLLGLDTPVKQDVTMNHIIREYVGIDPDNFDMLDDGNTITVEGQVIDDGSVD